MRFNSNTYLLKICWIRNYQFGQKLNDNKVSWFFFQIWTILLRNISCLSTGGGFWDSRLRVSEVACFQAAVIIVIIIIIVTPKTVFGGVVPVLVCMVWSGTEIFLFSFGLVRHWEHQSVSESGCGITNLFASLVMGTLVCLLVWLWEHWSVY